MVHDNKHYHNHVPLWVNCYIGISINTYFRNSSTVLLYIAIGCLSYDALKNMWLPQGLLWNVTVEYLLAIT